ncbi:hypothetical protein [Microbacterium candidum]|uniref:N-acyl-D-glucosamine 2-epimerase n=1 Tax=Microbacterium candidum TaxID=3041922 RepID=A0ABT7N0I0_9MICO|nr:hypothetical protein [Microbacterium sp. ASV49]MDL9980210.1 hypothetical protein [Microbacterium sp. ASV49]
MSLVVRTESAELSDLLAWAVDTAAGHVIRGGTTGPLDVDEHHPGGRGTAVYAPCYRAGYSHRSGYYLRDFCHQAVGAHLAGLRTENAGMLASFVASTVDGWPAWALNFDGTTPLAIDVKPDGRRVRELPAVFELVETIHAVHRWTGRPVDAEAAAFAKRTVTDFVAAHDRERRNGIAEAGGASIFDGVASYDESPELRMFEAGDGIASQYAATRHAAALTAAAGGDPRHLAAQAHRIHRHYREEWSRDGGDTVVSGWTREGVAAVGWHREATWFPPMKGLLAGDPRQAAELARIDGLALAPGTAPQNLEALTYLPDVFLRAGDVERAFAWMLRIFSRRDEPHIVPQQGVNGTYPEVAFTLLAQGVAGLLGLEPDAGAGRLTLAPNLARAVSTLEADGIPFGDGDVDVAVDASTVRVHNGTSRPLEVRLARRRRGVHRDPHLAVAEPGETVEPGRSLRLTRVHRP